MDLDEHLWPPILDSLILVIKRSEMKFHGGENFAPRNTRQDQYIHKLCLKSGKRYEIPFEGIRQISNIGTDLFSIQNELEFT